MTRQGFWMDTVENQGADVSDILDLIDHAVWEYEAWDPGDGSIGDAMRWAPPQTPPELTPEQAQAIMQAFSTTFDVLTEHLRLVFDAFAEHLQPLLDQLGENIRRHTQVAAELDQAGQAGRALQIRDEHRRLLHGRRRTW
jgi:hypothetical protein